MYKKFPFNVIVFLCWIILLAACTESRQSTATTTPLEVTLTAKSTEVIETPIPSMTPTMAFLPTQTMSVPSITPTQVQPQVINPDVHQMCFEPKSSLAEIGVRDELFLVQTYDAMGNVQMESRSAMVVHPTTLQPEPIPGTAPQSGGLLWSYNATPDGLWVELKYVSQKRDRVEEMLKSWNGRQSKSVFNSGDYALYSYKFLYSENLLIKADETNKNYRPVSITDLDTGIEINLPGFPKNAYWGRAIDIVYESRKDVYNFIYWGGEAGKGGRLYLYNSSDHVSVPAFPWILERGGWLTATPYRDINGNFGIYAFRNYGLDLAVDLDIQTVLEPKSYGEMMKKVLLPGGEMEGSLDLVIQKLNDGLLLVKKTAKNERRFAVYRLDFSDFGLADFCLSSEADAVTVAVSFDERYAAINFFRLEQPGYHVSEVVLLDLKKGRRTHIPKSSFEIVGWLKENK